MHIKYTTEKNIKLKSTSSQRGVLGDMVHQLRTALPSLGAANQAAAELDSLLALARAAKEHRLVRPQLTEDNVLHITEGVCMCCMGCCITCHPSPVRDLITEALVEQCIPNDCVMYGDRARIHLITGPNSSGKSSYMRAVCCPGAIIAVQGSRCFHDTRWRQWCTWHTWGALSLRSRHS